MSCQTAARTRTYETVIPPHRNNISRHHSRAQFWNTVRQTIHSCRNCFDRKFQEPSEVQLLIGRVEHFRAQGVLLGRSLWKSGILGARLWGVACLIESSLAWSWECCFGPLERGAGLEASTSRGTFTDDSVPTFLLISQTDGRPKFVMLMDEVHKHSTEGYKQKEIGNTYGVSERTIRCRIQKNLRSSLNDAELTIVVKSIMKRFPAAGLSYMMGQLRCMRIKVSRSRLVYIVHQYVKLPQETRFLLLSRCWCLVPHSRCIGNS